MSATDRILRVLAQHYRREPHPTVKALALLARHDADTRAASDDEQAYDGELAMLRGLFRTLRVVVRPDDPEVDVAEVRRLLHHHADDDAAARQDPNGGDDE